VRDVNTDVEPAGTQAGLGAKRGVQEDDAKPAHGDASARGAGAAGRAAQQTPGQVHGIGMLEHVLHTLSGLATMPEARARLMADAQFPQYLVACLRYTLAPKVMQFAMDCVSRLSSESVLQDKLVDAGVLWRLVPLLFRYDLTLEEAQSSGNVANTQKAANMQAKLAVRCFSRLGGYLDGANASPKNDRVQRMLRALLTPILARRLVRLNPEALLETLVNTVERADVVWTSAMRTELVHLCVQHTDAIDEGMPANADAAQVFHFKALEDLLQMSGIYVKFYLADPGLTLDDPYAFCRDLLRHIAYSPAGAGARNVRLERLDPGVLLSPDDAEIAEDCLRFPVDVARRHLRTALRALHLAVVNNPGLEDEISGESSRYLGSLFQLLHISEEGLEIIDDLAALSDKKGGAGGGVAIQSAGGSGLSAGAGGARSMAASSMAPLRELVLTAIAAFISNEECSATITSMHLLPGLIRMLPHDAAGVGSVLRTLFTHTCVVDEIAATGCIIDLCTIFAGGVASGPAPGAAGGPSVSAPPKLTMSATARAQAGALLSLICTDTAHGPPNFMALTQLLPDALARQVQQSLASATGTGSGAAGVGTTGTGTGAAGAANASGALGDAVKIFDADHETPELVWDVTSRHELRAALGELGRGLTGFRQRIGTKDGAAGPDSVRWSMPAVFRVRYTVTEGELRVGGVYVRLFLKEPTFPLRDPKGFLEALLRRLVQEGNHLIGMTSEDSAEVASATAAAKAEAEDEEKSGGVKVVHVSEKQKAAATQGGSSLVLRGEDVATQITHGIVCLLRTRAQLCEHVAALGYVDTLVPMLGRCSGKSARFDLSIQCMRVLQVLGGDKVAVVAMAKCNAIRMVLRSMQPLHRDAAFTLEALEAILKTDQQCGHGMVQQMLAAGAVDMLMQWVSTEDVSHLIDQSAFKVHAIAILKLLEGDELHGPAAVSRLGGHSAEWDKYKYQKHDLFISKNDTRDYFLADVEKAPSLLLKNAGAAAAASPSKRRNAAPATPLMLHDDTKPPPPPGGFSGGSGGASAGFGGFQAPAPAPSGFGGFQAPAPASTAFGAPPPVTASRTYGAAPSQAALFDAPAPAPAPLSAAAPVAGGGSAPFQARLGGGAPAAPAPARAAGGVDPFSGIGSASAAPSSSTAGDPFAGLVGSSAPAPANSDDLFSGMSASQSSEPAQRKPSGYKDPFAGLMD
jgi:DnaJ family protein C protein 13